MTLQTDGRLYGQLVSQYPRFFFEKHRDKYVFILSKLKPWQSVMRKCVFEHVHGSECPDQPAFVQSDQDLSCQLPETIGTFSVSLLYLK